MFSNMSSLVISSSRWSTNFFKGVKSKQSDDAFEFLFWHSSGKYEHSTFKNILEFNIPLVVPMSNVSIIDILSNTSSFKVFWLADFSEVWIIQCGQFLLSSISFSSPVQKDGNKTCQKVLWKENFLVLKCFYKYKTVGFLPSKTSTNQKYCINISSTHVWDKKTGIIFQSRIGVSDDRCSVKCSIAL